MKQVPLLNSTAIGLCAGALILNLAFLFFVHNKRSEFYYGRYDRHFDVALSVYNNNQPTMNPERMNYWRKILPENRLPDFTEIKDMIFEGPNIPYPVIDLPTYGALIGFLWKLTDSMTLLDIQIIQILMFSILMFLVYQIAYLLFESRRAALAASLSHIFLYLPLVFVNVQPLRDVWGYYGSVILLYGLLAYLFRGNSIRTLMVCSVIASLFQLIRPTLVGTFAALIAVLLGFTLVGKIDSRKAARALGTIVISNAIFFWMPFVAYSLRYHDKYLISPSGVGFIEGLGEFKNPWGFKQSDAFYAELMKERYGLEYGTQECEDRARKLFWELFWENPGHVFLSSVRRIPYLLCPLMPWFAGSWINESVFVGLKTVAEKISRIPQAITYASFWIDLLGRKLFGALFMLLAYAGIYFSIKERRWFALVFLLGGIVMPVWPFIFTIVIHRLLVPYYWPFALFVGYALSRIKFFVSTNPAD